MDKSYIINAGPDQALYVRGPPQPPNPNTSFSSYYLIDIANITHTLSPGIPGQGFNPYFLSFSRFFSHSYFFILFFFPFFLFFSFLLLIFFFQGESLLGIWYTIYVVRRLVSARREKALRTDEQTLL